MEGKLVIDFDKSDIVSGGVQRREKRWEKESPPKSFPNLFSLTPVENVMRSRKGERRIQKDLGKDNCCAEGIRLHLHSAT